MDQDQKNSSTSTVSSKDRYVLTDKISVVTNQIIRVRSIPQTGDTVYGYYNKVGIVLGNVIGNGGEGTIYQVSKTIACKIYKAEKITIATMEKIRLMLSKPISDPNICWPIDIVTDKDGRPLGYIMPVAKGFNLNRVHNRSFIQQNFPKWKKIDVAILAYTIATKIKYLHDRNVIIGDINTRNIMFTSPYDVFFVDTDSFQIEGFVCPVGTNEFTCREILMSGKNFGSFLRNFGHENFAIAMLFFVLLMNGRHPYSYRGGEDTVTNIKTMLFPYSYMHDDKNVHLIPAGNWKKIWDGFPPEIQGAFYSTFNKHGNHNTNETRLNIGQWMAILANYINKLDRGKKSGLELEIFPDLQPISKQAIKKSKAKVTMATSIYDNSLEKYNRKR